MLTYSRLRLFLCTILLGASATSALAAPEGRALPAIVPIPAELSSTHFTVSIGSLHSPVMHAVGSYYLLNFEMDSPTEITITADNPHYWDSGVEIQPMRLGIRPHRDGATIRFTLDKPAKLSITRPGDFFADSEMLFLFANQPDRSGITAETPGIRYYAPGIHRGSIDAQTGDRIYLAPGAVVYGALNIWQVHDVHVFGLGTIIYEGPQNPNDDEGWMHKPNWHVIVMDNAHDIEIEGITGIVRSRTWMVQLRDSSRLQFRNIKVIGGGPGNANQDGIDWLGGGDSLVQDSFFRAADDIFAAYGNWDGYSDQALTTPGHEVSNITIENSVLSTSISNVVRVGWPRKIFDSHNFTLRNSDVIHMGIGGCGVPFALFEIWADPGGKGLHTGFRFEDIRLDDSYSLTQLRQPAAAIRDVTFKDIWLMDSPNMVPSVFKGDVSGVNFDGVDSANPDASGKVDLQSVPNQEAPQDNQGPVPPTYKQAVLSSGFNYASGLIRPNQPVEFTALEPEAKGLHYHWLFGDGSEADGRKVQHRFADTQGTLLDASPSSAGRFRVLLHVFDNAGHQSWASQSIVVANELLTGLSKPPSPKPGAQPISIAGQISQSAVASNPVSSVFDRYIHVPASGGYTLTLLTSTEAKLAIDGLDPVKSPKSRPQVCGSRGNAVQATNLSASLSAGWHRVQVIRDAQIENADSIHDQPVLYWAGPGIPQQLIPAEVYNNPTPNQDKEP